MVITDIESYGHSGWQWRCHWHPFDLPPRDKRWNKALLQTGEDGFGIYYNGERIDGTEDRNFNGFPMTPQGTRNRCPLYSKIRREMLNISDPGKKK